MHSTHIYCYLNAWYIYICIVIKMHGVYILLLMHSTYNMVINAWYIII